MGLTLATNAASSNAAMKTSADTFKTTILTLAAGLAGFALARWIGFPAPALTGPSLLVMLLSLTGLRLEVPIILRNGCFVIIGLSLGTGVTPEVYQTAAQWPVSFLFLAASVVMIFILCKTALRRLWKQDRATAILSSVPGHLSYILGLSTQSGGNIAMISVVQSTRVLALTLLVPFAVGMMGYDVFHPAPPGLGMDPLVLVASFSLALLLGLVLLRFKVPAALLLGGMLLSTSTHLTGLVEGLVPHWASVPAFVIMGAMIGSRFSGVSLAMLRMAFVAGLALTLIAFAVTIFFALCLVQFVDLPLPQVLIAFAPGGVESMAAMALIMHADPTFVAAHHVWRLVILTFMAPVLLGGTAANDDAPSGWGNKKGGSE